jgi:hypothetical protein
MLAVGLMWGIQAIVAVVVLKTVPLPALVPLGLLAYGSILLAVSRGPRVEVHEAPPWLRYLLLWRGGRNGFPFLFLLMMLGAGALAVWNAARMQ